MFALHECICVYVCVTKNNQQRRYLLISIALSILVVNALRLVSKIITNSSSQNNGFFFYIFTFNFVMAAINNWEDLAQSWKSSDHFIHSIQYSVLFTINSIGDRHRYPVSVCLTDSSPGGYQFIHIFYFLFSRPNHLIFVVHTIHVVFFRIQCSEFWLLLT